MKRNDFKPLGWSWKTFQPGGDLIYIKSDYQQRFDMKQIFDNLDNLEKIRSFDNRFEVNRPPEPTLVLRWISKFFLFGALPSDTLKIKHTKNLKEIPSRHVLENLLEKSKHSCLYTSETHWQFTGILPIYNGRHAKSHNSRL